MSDSAAISPDTTASSVADVDAVDPAGTDAANDVDKPSDGVSFTQEDIDRIIEKRLARERSRHEREIDELKSTVGKTEAEVASARIEKAEATVAALTERLHATLVRSAAVEAAYAADIKPEKIEAVLRLADLPSLTEDGDVDAKSVKSAIAAVVKENPEWVRLKGTGKAVGAGDRQQVPTESEPTSIEAAVAKYFN